MSPDVRICALPHPFIHSAATDLRSLLSSLLCGDTHLARTQPRVERIGCIAELIGMNTIDDDVGKVHAAPQVPTHQPPPWSSTLFANSQIGTVKRIIVRNSVCKLLRYPRLPRFEGTICAAIWASLALSKPVPYALLMEAVTTAQASHPVSVLKLFKTNHTCCAPALHSVAVMVQLQSTASSVTYAPRRSF